MCVYIYISVEMPPYNSMDIDDDDESEECFLGVIDPSSSSSSSSSTQKPNNNKKESSMACEKQISVDPISVRQPSSHHHHHHRLRHQLVNVYPTSPTIDFLIPLPPSSKTNFVSQSLPNSASSSPRLPSNISNKKMKHQSQPSSLSAMYRSDSIALANIDSLHEINLLKSKSCGEGRASEPPEDFDLCSSNVKHQDNHIRDNTNYYKIESNNSMDDDDNKKGEEENMDTFDDKFKCRALCLYLPGFHKGKPVKARRQGSDMSQSKESESSGHVVSKRVSLEKFECVSWTSSGRIMNDNEYEGDASNLFFDLPLELIKCSLNDTDSPETTAFVFDKEPKPVLKKSISKCAFTKSSESVRHVRFSTSYSESPNSSCNKSRDDFSAYFETQSSALNVL